MANDELNVVIMAGGRGERFWPRSRRSRPKQFARILGEKTMLAETADRFKGLTIADRIFVSTGAAYLDLVRESLPGVADRNLLVEPMARDTAAAVALAAFDAPCGEDDLLFFVPADHFIGEVEKYHRNIREACDLVREEDCMVLLGITPDQPSENYGYLKLAPGKGAARRLAGFREKPDRETAAKWLAEGDHLWNAGMFLFTKRILRALYATHAPEHLDKVESFRRLRDEGKKAEAEAVFAAIPRISFDYAVVEKAEKLFCVAASFQWDDVGSWNAVARLRAGENGNVTEGGALVSACKDTLVLNDRPDLFVVANSLEGIAVVVTGNSVYVTTRDQENRVKKVLAELEPLRPDLL